MLDENKSKLLIHVDTLRGLTAFYTNTVEYITNNLGDVGAHYLDELSEIINLAMNKGFNSYDDALMDIAEIYGEAFSLVEETKHNKAA
ncbi:hypothetical protein AB4345_05295 [Vibrio breoganii]